ncbi:hypothetical protein [Bifidobacterium callitrichos]|uniref:hypothetical protein n=1 Tax=Bifidobacterium callitrichos TaxID=762209 RepID=UPI00168BF816|nr:hypothetical protein [Bifidobacterium callitrichos]
MKHYRKAATRYDRLDTTFLANLQLILIAIQLKTPPAFISDTPVNAYRIIAAIGAISPNPLKIAFLGICSHVSPKRDVHFDRVGDTPQSHITAHESVISYACDAAHCP